MCTCLYINTNILRALVVDDKIRRMRERPSHILTQSNSLLSLTCVQRAFFTRRKKKISRLTVFSYTQRFIYCEYIIISLFVEEITSCAANLLIRYSRYDSGCEYVSVCIRALKKKNFIMRKRKKEGGRNSTCVKERAIHTAKQSI